MKIYCGILFICITILTSSGNALEIIKPQQNGAIPGSAGISSSTIGAVMSSKSPVYRSIPQTGRQMKDHVPVRLKVYGNNPNGPPKVVARYAPPPSYHSPVRYFRPAPGMIPAIRRRYQISNGPQPSSMSQHKRMTPASYPPNNYNKVRRYPTKSYKYPVYYKKKPVSGNYNSELPRKGYYHQSQGAGGGPPLEPKISGNSHRQHPNKKNFYPSPHFDGKVIVKPNGEKYNSGNSGDIGYGKTQYTSHQQHVNFPEHSEHHYHYKPVINSGSSSSISSSNMREREPSPSSYNQQEYYQSNRHYGNSNYPNLNKYGVNNENNSPYGNKYSSYSVYDDSDTDDDDDDSDSYATDSPVKYYVESNTDSNINSNHNNNNEIAEAKKYLEFMSSSNYFLPKVSPDYHTKSIGYNNFNVPTSTEPISSKLNIQNNYNNNNNDNEQLYQNYKSQRINLGPGSSTGIRISSKISTSGNGNTGNNNNNNPSNVDSIIVGQHNNHHYDIDSSQQQNTFYRPSRKHHQLMHHQHHGPEKIEFTESDAIHSSYTSNPKEILDHSPSSTLYGSNSDGSNGGGSSIASAVDDIKAKYGLSPKYKVSYQSAKISHLHPHRIIKYQASSHSKNNNHNNDDRNDDDNDDDTHNDDNDDDINNDDDDDDHKK